MQLPRLLTPDEAASIPGVTKATLEVWRCTKRYDLPYVKSGRLVRYRETDLAKFIESRVRGGQTEPCSGPEPALTCARACKNSLPAPGRDRA